MLYKNQVNQAKYSQDWETSYGSVEKEPLKEFRYLNASVCRGVCSPPLQMVEV